LLPRFSGETTSPGTSRPGAPAVVDMIFTTPVKDYFQLAKLFHPEKFCQVLYFRQPSCNPT
jgi:hypothetical protein